MREFQRSVGVAPDGTCGPERFRAIERLARTMSGGGGQRDLREMDALEALTSGVANKVVVLDPGRGRQRPAHPPAVPGLTEAMVIDDLASQGRGPAGRDRGAGAAHAGTGGRHRDGRGRPGAVRQRRRGRPRRLADADRVDSPPGNGFATFYYGDSATGTGSALGARVAEMVQDEISPRTDLADCRTHAKSWDLLRLTRMPSVHVECGYLTSPYDAPRLADPAFRDALAEGMAAAVSKVSSPRPPSRPRAGFPRINKGAGALLRAGT